METYDLTLKRIRLSTIIVLLFASSLIYLNGCKERSTSPVENPPTNTGGEVNGGLWKPILISSGSAYILPPPPDNNSLQTQNELNELRSYQSNRTQEMTNNINYWNKQGIIRWNEIARHLVIKHSTNPPLASRAYALLSTVQFDALISAWYNKYLYKRSHPSEIDFTIVPAVTPNADPCYPCEHAVIASASKHVLSYLFPNDIDSINYWANQEMISRLQAGCSSRSDIKAGDSLGALIANVFISYAMADGSDAVWTGTIPTGPGMWYSNMQPPQQPLLPMWGKAKPWLLTQLPVITPPPVFNSDEFNAALAEVKHYSDTRTAEQLQIAKFWADGAGTSTPPGHWNEIACNYMKTTSINEIRTARALALMNMAIMDAGICCWDAKYQFWLIRPSQVDKSITTPVGLPNFPSYTSGHSSFSGAAHTVLGYLFPSKAAEFKSMAEEAAISRLYGGIHYRFDSDVGLESGRTVGKAAIQRAINDGSN